MGNFSDLKKIKEDVGLEKIQEFRNEHLFMAHGGFTKYLDFEVSMLEAIWRARETGLLSRNSLDVLDIGCGAGYISYVYSSLGQHHVVAVDNNEDPFLTGMAKLLKVDYRNVFVRPLKSLPDLGLKFDWITGHNCTFDHKWSPGDYAFFIRDLIANQLKPGGRIFFSLNYNYQNQAIIERIKSCGFRVHQDNRILYGY